MRKQTAAAMMMTTGVARSSDTNRRAATSRTAHLLLTASAAMFALVLSVTAAAAQGIQPLNLESAAAAANEKDMVLNSPVLIAIQNGHYGRVEDPRSAPFVFFIETPYSRVTAIASEARRKFVDPKYPSIEALNASRVNVIVIPGRNMSTVGTIENVVIKRGDQMTRPLAAEVTPTTVQNGFGMTKETARGRFTFDYAAFDSGNGPVTLVLVGSTGNYEWTMTPDDLLRMK
jgi:hypothetical protein